MPSTVQPTQPVTAPLFKEKAEKNVEREETTQESYHGLNKSYSERNMRPKQA